jgi:hypothetical protein
MTTTTDQGAVAALTEAIRTVRQIAFETVTDQRYPYRTVAEIAIDPDSLADRWIARVLEVDPHRADGDDLKRWD